MKAGDLVMFHDGVNPAEPVLLIRMVPDTLPGGMFDGAVVINKLGQRWVDLRNLMSMGDWEMVNVKSR